MTNDERKRQRELFEKSLDTELRGTPDDEQVWWYWWQKACDANGVGEPPADGERDEIEKRLEAFSNLHIACSNLASKLDGMEWDNDEVNRFRLLFAPIRRVLYKVAAALAKREEP